MWYQVIIRMVACHSTELSIYWITDRRPTWRMSCMQDLVRTEREPSTRDLASVWNWRKCSSPRQIMTRCHTTRLTCSRH